MKIFLAAVIILGTLNAYSAEYRLSDLIEHGLQQCYEMTAARSEERNALSQLRSSWYGLLPRLSLSASQEAASIEEPEWSRSATLSLSKTISLNEPSYYDIRTSHLSRRNAALLLASRRQEVAFSIFSRYLYVLEYQKRLSIQERNLELQRRIHNQIQVQYETGEKSLLDLKQSAVTLIDYEVAVLEAERNLVSARRGLFSYLNLEDAGWDLEEPEFMLGDQAVEYRDNYELQQQRNDLRSSRLLMWESRLHLIPQLSAGYSYNRSSGESGIWEFSDYSESHSLYLLLSYDLFDLPSLGESYVRSRRNLRLQERLYVETEKNLREELSDLLRGLETLQRSYELYRDKLQLASENLQMAEEQFRLGMISLLDLDRSMIDYQNSQLQYNNSYYGLVRQQEEINKLLSQPILGQW